MPVLAGTLGASSCLHNELQIGAASPVQTAHFSLQLQHASFLSTVTPSHRRGSVSSVVSESCIKAQSWGAQRHLKGRELRVSCQAEKNGAGRSDSEEREEGHDAGGSGKVALLFEVEGAMVDLHKVGHLEAHNAAFLASGIDWARWNIATYNSLHRRTGGDPASMLRVFFDTQRWPIDGMDAAAKEEMVLRLVQLKVEALRNAVELNNVPLRPGLVDILQEAMAAGCHVAAIAMQAKCGEDTARKLLMKLPENLQKHVLVVGKKEAEGSLFWQVVLKGGEDSPQAIEDTLAAKLSEAVVAKKQEVAQQVAKVLKVRADVDTGGVGSQGMEGVAALRAACELLEVPLARVVVLAGSQGMVQTATRAGIPSIAVRSSLTSQAEFPGTLQVYEDFGPGSLTVSRLVRRLGLS